MRGMSKQGTVAGIVLRMVDPPKQNGPHYVIKRRVFAYPRRESTIRINGCNFHTHGANTMNAHDALRLALTTAEMISLGYLSDLSDSDLLVRPVPGRTTSPGSLAI